MKVSTGASWKHPSGNWQNCTVEIDEDDLTNAGLYPETMTNSQKKAALTGFADLAVVDYMHENGGITDSFFDTRVTAIKVKMKKGMAGGG